MKHEMNSKQFYRSRQWQRKREKVLKRDRYLCQRCLRYGRRRAATVVHHKKHLEDHPELALDDENLVSLCNECHNAEHPEKGDARRMWR